MCKESEIKIINDPALLAIFIEEAEEVAELLTEIHAHGYKSEADIEMFTIKIHAMKSALANIEEISLSQFAYKLEKCAEEKEIDVLKKETGLFIEKLKDLIAQPIKEKEKYENEAVIGDNKKILIQDKLTDFKKACDDLNKKEAKEILNQLKHISIDMDERIKTLSAYLLHGDFDLASQEAERIIIQFSNQK